METTETQTVNIDQALASFGLSEFRAGQREVIQHIVSGNDCLCVMPTGGGKSLCYQLPSLIRPGLTIVVSPLIALMKDQVDALVRMGIPAALINSTLSMTEQYARLEAATAGKYKLIYVAPERLRNPKFLESIRSTPIQLLAVDEAHCISQWGHDFRPDYSRIGQFRQWLGGVQTVALTATATPRVRQDIMDVLGLSKARQFMSGFARPNLHFGVVTCMTDREKDQELASFLGRTKGSGIIYAATRKRCETLVEWIGQKLKRSVGVYHAGLMNDQRRVIQERFMSGQLDLIVATNAFGMGIDKPDLRFVIHYNMPGSLEAYYQEAGRAGRDGKESVCVLLYSYNDRAIQEFFIDNNYPPRSLIKSVYEFLQQIEDDPIELTLEEIRDQMGLSISPEAIGSSLQILSRTRVIERLEMGAGLAMVRINSDLPSLVELLPRDAKVRRSVLRLIERAVGDRRFEDVYLHPRWLIQQSGMEREALVRHLKELSQLEQFDYVPPFRGRAVHFHKKDIPFDELNIDFDNLKKRKEAELERLNQVIQYAQSPLCRQATIIRYFGDPNAERCGQCDRCQRQAGWPRLNLNQTFTKQSLSEGLEHSHENSQEIIPQAEVRQKISRREEKPDSKPKSQPPRKTSAVGTKRTGSSVLTPTQQTTFLAQLLETISSLHGRLGKILIAQYLCGSSNSKLQKLNLHRMSGFGTLRGFTQSEAIELLDSLLGSGVLRQQEVNRYRPTVSVSPELSNTAVRNEVLSAVEIPHAIALKIQSLMCRLTTAQASGNTPHFTAMDQSTFRKPEFVQSDSTDSPAARSKNTIPTTPAPTQSVETEPQADIPRQPLPASANRPDWHWTLELLRAGYNWNVVRAMRRMSDEQLSADCCEALKVGETIERKWLHPPSGEVRTAGQQRVVRELQRRNSAGV